MKLLTALLALVLLSTPSLATENNDTKRALARQTIEAMQADKMLDNMGVQLKQLVLQQIPVPKDATPEQRKLVDELIGEVMTLSMNEAKIMMTKMDAIYAEVYTEAELSAMAAFFTSAEGQSMVAKQPKLMETMMPMLQEMQRNMMPKIKKLVDEAKADLAATPPEE